MLQESEGGEYVVTSLLDPQLIKEAEKVEEAFENTRDAPPALIASLRKLIKMQIRDARLWRGQLREVSVESYEADAQRGETMWCQGNPLGTK
jgi:hypothetical protein